MSKTWKEQWTEQVSNIPDGLPYAESSEKLRQLIRTGLLRFTDLETDPKKFFEAHRILVDPIKRGPGFWIRFTVQYNLFAGTVLGLGSEEQLVLLEEIQEKGQLGCFGLTEKLAGVNSGLVVNTKATWDAATQTFILSSENTAAHKNWISQGLIADKCAVIADLFVDGTSHGPHGFLMDLRVDGKVVDGVELGDMGRKTTGNDLDNAWINFHHVKLPKSALLNRFADIVDNKYVQKGKKLGIEIIGQRLLSGRVAVAQAALEFAIKLFAHTRAYADKKMCWSPKGNVPLSEIPQLLALFLEADRELGKLCRFASIVESQLNEGLLQGKSPSFELIQAIACMKVASVEGAISYCFKLKQEVGSYALMGDTGFEHMDFLQCCKFAEGDGRILMQKLSRDRVKMQASKKSPVCSAKENELSDLLMKAGKGKWDENWEKVYELAFIVINRIISEFAPAASL